MCLLAGWHFGHFIIDPFDFYRIWDPVLRPSYRYQIIAVGIPIFTIANAGINLWCSIRVLPLKCSKSSMLGLLYSLPIGLYPFSLPELTDDFFE